MIFSFGERHFWMSTLGYDLLCWFQTSLPLAALPLRSVIIACCFRVAVLSGNAALALSPSGIAPEWIEFNCLRSAAVGKAARLSIYWLDAACRLVIPLGQVALAQLNKYHHQSGNAASGNLVWNQHYSPLCNYFTMFIIILYVILPMVP